MRKVAMFHLIPSAENAFCENLQSKNKPQNKTGSISQQSMKTKVGKTALCARTVLIWLTTTFEIKGCRTRSRETSRETCRACWHRSPFANTCQPKSIRHFCTHPHPHPHPRAHAHARALTLSRARARAQRHTHTHTLHTRTQTQTHAHAQHQEIGHTSICQNAQSCHA